MYSSIEKSNSIGNALFDVAVQLSVPTVTSTASVSPKTRAYTTLDTGPSLSRYASLRKSTSSLSTLVIPVPKRSDLHVNQGNYLAVPVDKNNNEKISSKSDEYLSVPKYSSYSISSHRQRRSIKKALMGLWPGLNHDHSLPSNLLNSKSTEERPKKHSPSWRAFTKVVTSLLTFTRTRKGRYEWIQLVGHPGTFKEGLHEGFVMKELTENERRCCEFLQHDALRNFVPRYNGTVQDEDGKYFIEMEDLLASFHEPCIMDCKIGVRTYLEEDLDKSERDPEPRADLYNKMIAIDPNAPTEKEHQEKKVLKPRYMIWRESLSSSQELGFRIEAIKKSRGLMSKEFQRIKEREDVKNQLREFIGYSIDRARQYLERLVELRFTCLRSKFFQTHEIIGSSLLFVHDEQKASVWMIDFGKTRPLPNGIAISHLRPWIRGSHEDGYLIGLDHLISLFEDIIAEWKYPL